MRLTISKRRHFTGAEKVKILKRHLLLEQTPTSTLCEEFKIDPSQFHQWLRDFFGNGHAAFENSRQGTAQTDAKDREIAALKAKNLFQNLAPFSPAGEKGRG